MAPNGVGENHAAPNRSESCRVFLALVNSEMDIATVLTEVSPSMPNSDTRARDRDIEVSAMSQHSPGRQTATPDALIYTTELAILGLC